MEFTLEGVWLKFERGCYHMDEAQTFVQEFCKSKPYSIRVEMNTDTGDKLFIANGEVKPVPLLISAVVGDAIFNFRSVLDHLAWQLVIANGEEPTDRTCFPICTNPNQWGRAQERLKGMSDSSKKIIQSEQPCFNRHTHRKQQFTWLEELCNIDKHRHLNLVQSGSPGGFFTPTLPMDANYYIHNGIVESNTILARFPQPYADVNFNPIIDIAFGEGTSAYGHLVNMTLLHFKILVENTIKMFFP